MQLRFFTIPVHGGDEAEESLNRFLGGHRIQAIDRSFVQDGANSAWSLCVSFEPAGERAQMNKRGIAKIDYREVLNGSVAVGVMRSFHIRDPKPRIIHAPCFRERVLHHALIAPVGPVLDRALIDDTYACRVGKGTLAAVQRGRRHLERHPWYAKIDIRYDCALAVTAHADATTWRREQLRRRPLAGALLYV